MTREIDKQKARVANMTTRQLKTAETISALATTNSQVQAAALLDINISTLKRRLSKWGIRDMIAEGAKAAEEKLLLNAEKAADSLTQKINSEDENVSLKASTEILDRTGVTKKQSETTVNLNYLNIARDQRKEYDL